MRKTRAKKPSTLETSISSRLVCTLLCGVFLLSTMAMVVPESQADSTRSECGQGKDVQLQLDTTWEQLTVQHPSIVCTFRPKSGGFPTATVAWEARVSVSISNSEASRAEAIIQSYQRVGLTDARILETQTTTADNRSTFTALVSYTTLGTPMMAIISIVDSSARTFTLTLLDTAENFSNSRPRLTEIARTFEVVDDSRRSAPADSAPLGPAVWLGLLMVGCIVVALVALAAIRALRR